MEEILSKSTYGARRAGLASLSTMALVTTAVVAGAGAASAATDFKFDRIGGQNRYDTSQYVADEFASANKNVILANGSPTNYADALSANTLAGEMQSPILLTTRDKTPAPVLKQLDDDNVAKITVVGGPAVVSDAQVANLRSLGYTVERVSGDDRFGTNAEVIGMSGAAKGGVGLIATGFNFPDALSAGPFSYQGHPLGLTTRDSIDDQVVSALDDAGVTKVLIFGGTDVVKPAVEAKLATKGITVEKRFAGADRSETSTLAAKYATDTLGFTKAHVGVASGYVKGYGADALSGGPLEGKEVAPMLITKDVNNPGVVDDYLDANCGPLKTGHIFGLQAAISAAQETTLTDAAQCKNTPAPANPFGPNSSTGAPELQSVTVSSTDKTVVTYKFDESIPGQALDFFGAAPNRTYPAFRLYDTAGKAYYPLEARVSGDSVIARFASADTVKAAVRGTVRHGAVEDASGIANIEGEIPMAPTVITNTVNPFKPQLVDVRNFRLADVIVGGVQEVLVDYVFDSNPTAVGLTGDDFHLVGSNSQDYPGQAIVGVPTQNTDKTWTVTVQFAQDLNTVPESQLRRGFVNYPAGDGVVLSDAYENGTGQTVDPDLVSAQVSKSTPATAYTVRYVFDEAISDNGLDAGEFYLYDANGTTIFADSVGRSALAADGATVVLATFDLTQETDFQPVGAFILDGAVKATDNTASDNGGFNRPDERDLTLPAPTTTTIPPGFTALPDLLAVDVQQNQVTENYSVTYLFDESCSDLNADQVSFDLYDATGTQFRVDGATAGGGVTIADPNTTDTIDQCAVTFSIDEGFAQFDNEQIAAAVTGAVEDSDSVAVVDNNGTPADTSDDTTTVTDPVVTEGQQDVS